MVLITFQPEHEPMQQLHVDDRAFEDLKPFEAWLGITPAAEAPKQKAA